MSKTIAIVLAVAIVVGGGAFWGGMTYAQSKMPARGGQFAAFAGAGGARGGARLVAGGGGAFGTIIAKDANSITILMATGTTTGSASGTKIILYDNSTQVGKMVAGSAGDLTVGQMVMVAGSTNSDGSITAQMIQIRPPGAGIRGQ